MRRLEKDGDLGQDDRHLYEEEIQSLTDEHVEEIDRMLGAKETEIMQV